MKSHLRSAKLIRPAVAGLMLAFLAGTTPGANEPKINIEQSIKEAETVVVGKVAMTPAKVGAYFIEPIFTLKGADAGNLHMDGTLLLDSDKTYVLFLRPRKVDGKEPGPGEATVEPVPQTLTEATPENVAAVVKALKAHGVNVLTLRVQDQPDYQGRLSIFRLYNDGSFEEFRRPDPEKPEAHPKRAGKAPPDAAAGLRKQVAAALDRGVGERPGYSSIRWLDDAGKLREISYAKPGETIGPLLEAVETFIRRHTEKPSK